jgi:hypothetical protein
MLAKLIALSLVVAVLLGCSKPAPPSASADTPSGMWSGSYDLASDRRESIGLDLRWEGDKLQGVVHAGTRSIPLTKASFQRDTGAISMEFDAEGNGGRTVHYVIDGKVDGNSMTGTWKHDDLKGDFKVTKQ